MLATSEQFSTRLGRELDPDEGGRVEAILTDVSAIALGATGASWSLATVPADVQAVVLAAALRLFKNPDNYIEERVGSYSASVSSSQFSHGVFTKPEWDILRRNAKREGYGFVGFTTVRRTREERCAPYPDVEYWDVSPYGSPIPYLERW